MTDDPMAVWIKTVPRSVAGPFQGNRRDIMVQDEASERSPVVVRGASGWRVGLVAVLVLFLGLAAATGAGRAQTPETSIGRVKTLEGAASVVRGGVPLPLALGDPIDLMDEVHTGPDGSLGITFDDETLLSLGPDSVMVIDDMVYAPASGDARFSASLLGGSLSYVSGGIAKLRPENVTLSTPTATIGIRGTALAIRAPKR